jgi:hypothetical protein
MGSARALAMSRGTGTACPSRGESFLGRGEERQCSGAPRLPRPRVCVCAPPWPLPHPEPRLALWCCLCLPRLAALGASAPRLVAAPLVPCRHCLLPAPAPHCCLVSYLCTDTAAHGRTTVVIDGPRFTGACAARLLPSAHTPSNPSSSLDPFFPTLLHPEHHTVALPSIQSSQSIDTKSLPPTIALAAPAPTRPRILAASSELAVARHQVAGRRGLLALTPTTSADAHPRRQPFPQGSHLTPFLYLSAHHVRRCADSRCAQPSPL